MKQYDLISWAIRGLIEEKIQEPDISRRMELDKLINELCVQLLLEKQKEKK